MKRLSYLCLIGLLAAAAVPAACSRVFADDVFSDDFSAGNGPLLGTTADEAGHAKSLRPRLAGTIHPSKGANL